jgi:hypothetical protein
MLLTAVRVYQQGQKLTEAELRAAVGVLGDARTLVVQISGAAIRQAVRMGQTTASLPPLIEPQLTGISPLALGLEGYEEARTPRGSCPTVRAGGARCVEIAHQDKNPAARRVSGVSRNFLVACSQFSLRRLAQPIPANAAPMSARVAGSGTLVGSKSDWN